MTLLHNKIQYQLSSSLVKTTCTMRSKNTSPNQAGRVVGELYIYTELLVQISKFLVTLRGIIRVTNGFVVICELRIEDEKGKCPLMGFEPVTLRSAIDDSGLVFPAFLAPWYSG